METLSTDSIEAVTAPQNVIGAQANGLASISADIARQVKRARKQLIKRGFEIGSFPALPSVRTRLYDAVVDKVYLVRAMKRNRQSVVALDIEFVLQRPPGDAKLPPRVRERFPLSLWHGLPLLRALTGILGREFTAAEMDGDLNCTTFENKPCQVDVVAQRSNPKHRQAQFRVRDVFACEA
jgi:hypothetical protein